MKTKVEIEYEGGEIVAAFLSLMGEDDIPVLTKELEIPEGGISYLQLETLVEDAHEWLEGLPDDLENGRVHIGRAWPCRIAIEARLGDSIVTFDPTPERTKKCEGIKDEILELLEEFGATDISVERHDYDWSDLDETWEAGEEETFESFDIRAFTSDKAFELLAKQIDERFGMYDIWISGGDQTNVAIFTLGGKLDYLEVDEIVQDLLAEAEKAGGRCISKTGYKPEEGGSYKIRFKDAPKKRAKKIVKKLGEKYTNGQVSLFESPKAKS